MLTNACGASSTSGVSRGASTADSFHEHIRIIMESLSSRVSQKKRKALLPWLTPDCLNLMKVCDLLLKIFLKSSLTTDWLKFTAARNKVTQAMWKAKANFFIAIMESARGDGKKIWHNINKLTGKQNNKITAN